MVGDNNLKGSDRAETHASELSAELWSSKSDASPVSKLPPSDSRRNSVQLAELEISGLKKDDNDKLEDMELAAAKSKKADKPQPAEANTFLLEAAAQTVNQSIYQLPKWARLAKPAPDLGCVSSFSNRYREALRLAGLVDSVGENKYRNYYQVNMDELNKVMGRDKLLVAIPADQMKEGDIIQSSNPGTFKRHMGIVGGIENGKRMLYNNYGGTWRYEPLDERLGIYKEHRYYRAYLPPKS